MLMGHVVRSIWCPMEMRDWRQNFNDLTLNCSKIQDRTFKFEDSWFDPGNSCWKIKAEHSNSKFWYGRLRIRNEGKMISETQWTSGFRQTINAHKQTSSKEWTEYFLWAAFDRSWSYPIKWTLWSLI